MAGATTLSDLAGAIGIRAQESAVIAELKAGSEEAYAWLIAEFHQPIYSLVYRMVTDPSDAADTTQEVFVKVFRGINNFHGQSTLKTWIYRIALHEASNRRRWWFRHKSRETPLEPLESENNHGGSVSLQDNDSESPFEFAMHEEVRAKVEEEIRKIPEPFRTTIILRDLEELSYEEVAEITQVSLGTVKSRLTRGREALRRLLADYVQHAGPALGLGTRSPKVKSAHSPAPSGEGNFEVAS